MSQSERRRTPRKLVSIRASMRPENAGLLSLRIPGKITDLNRTGALLHAKETIREGQTCTLTLLADDGTTADIEATVIWVKRNASWEYDAGLAFHELAPEQARLIDLYLQPDAAPTSGREKKTNPKEKRRAPRKLVSMRAYVRTESEAYYGTPVKVQVRDLNHSGAMLHAPQLLKQGDRVTITLMADDGMTGTLEARIVWAENDDKGEYNAGVAFRNLTADEEYLIDLQMVRSK